jgi:hypothetical protein
MENFPVYLEDFFQFLANIGAIVRKLITHRNNSGIYVWNEEHSRRDLEVVEFFRLSGGFLGPILGRCRCRPRIESFSLKNTSESVLLLTKKILHAAEILYPLHA